jgi:hypothetical protein
MACTFGFTPFFIVAHQNNKLRSRFLAGVTARVTRNYFSPTHLRL